MWGNRDHKGDHRPEMYRVIISLIMLGHFVDLAMAVVTGGNAVLGPCGHDLVKLDSPKGAPGLGKTRL